MMFTVFTAGRSLVNESVKFNLEKVVRQAEINRGRLVYYTRHQCLTFADDTALVTWSKCELSSVRNRKTIRISKRNGTATED